MTIDGVFNLSSLSIWLRWRITLLKQRGLCELSEIAEILSIVNVTVFRFFIHKLYLYIWLYESTGAVDELPRTRIISNKRKISHRQGIKVSYERRLFSKMNFVPCRSSYHSSCYRILNRILNWQELRRVASVYWESLCGCNFQCLNKSLIRVSADKHSTNSYSL